MVLGFVSWKLAVASYATWNLFRNLDLNSISGLITDGLGFAAFIGALWTFIMIVQAFTKRDLTAQHVIIEKD
jgi:hypothetical protein